MKATAKLPTISELTSLNFSSNATLTASLFATTPERRLGIELNGDQFIPAAMLASQLGQIAAAIDAEVARTGTNLSKTNAARIKKDAGTVVSDVITNQKTIGQTHIDNIQLDLNGGTTPATALPATPTEAQLCARLGMPTPSGTDWAAKKVALASHVADVASDLNILSGYGLATTPALTEFNRIVSILDAHYDAQIVAGTTVPTPTTGQLSIDEFKVLANRLDNPHLSPYEKLGIPNPYITSSGKTFELHQPSELDRMTNTDRLELEGQITTAGSEISDQLAYARTEALSPTSPFHVYSSMLNPAAAGATLSILDQYTADALGAIDTHSERKVRAEGIKRLDRIEFLLGINEYDSLLNINAQELEKIKPSNILTNKYDRSKQIKLDVSTNFSALEAEINSLLTGPCKDLAHNTGKQDLVKNIEKGVNRILAGEYKDLTGQATPTPTPAPTPPVPTPAPKKSWFNFSGVGNLFSTLGKGVVSLAGVAGTYAGSIAAINWLAPVGATAITTVGGVAIAATAAIVVGVLLYRKLSK